MKTLKSIISISLLALLMMGFSQCSTVKKIQEEAPVSIGKVYFQKWVAGIKGGGSGLNIYIPVSDSSITLDSVYFRGMATNLFPKYQEENIYVGKFISGHSKKEDLVMNSDPKAEYGNKRAIVEENIPFELKHNECIISYTDGNKTKYFKIENIEEKAMIPYPSAPPMKQ